MADNTLNLIFYATFLVSKAKSHKMRKTKRRHCKFLILCSKYLCYKIRPPGQKTSFCEAFCGLMGFCIAKDKKMDPFSNCLSFNLHIISLFYVQRQRNGRKNERISERTLVYYIWICQCRHHGFWGFQWAGGWISFLFNILQTYRPVVWISLSCDISQTYWLYTTANRFDIPSGISTSSDHSRPSMSKQRMEAILGPLPPPVLVLRFVFFILEEKDT